MISLAVRRIHLKIAVLDLLFLRNLIFFLDYGESIIFRKKQNSFPATADWIETSS